MMLSVKNISFAYEKDLVLKNLNFELPKGQILAIAGESGSGKSTLLNLIYGQYDLNKGEMFWNEEQILGPKFNLIPGPDFMKMVSQEFDLMPFTSVAQNIGTFLSNFYLKKKAERTAELLEVVGLTSYTKKKVKNLSGGQKQRVALAKALANQPMILLLDEPFSHIDNLQKRILRRHVFDFIKDQQITCIVATHDKDDIIAYADQMLFLDQGNIMAYGSPETLYKNPPNAMIASFFDEFSMFDEHEDRTKENEASIYIYPHQLKMVDKSELNVHVDRSLFMGDHYLIEGQHEGRVVKFKHHEAIAKGETVFLEIIV